MAKRKDPKKRRTSKKRKSVRSARKKPAPRKIGFSKIDTIGTMTIAELSTKFMQNKIDLQPWFQRNSIWPEGARIGLIDTIFRNLPVPEIFLRVEENGTREAYSVIDGQQRITAILDFMQGKGIRKGKKFTMRQLPTSTIKIHDELTTPTVKTRSKEGKGYADLKPTDQDRFDKYVLRIREIKDPDDKKIEDLFRRLNTNVFENNPQELRNATYSGDMKQLAGKLTKDFHGDDFLLANKLVTEKNRMRQLDTKSIINEILLVADAEVIVGSRPVDMDNLYGTNEEMFGRNKTIRNDVLKTHQFLIKLFKADADGRRFISTVFSKPQAYLALFTTLYLMFTGNWVDKTTGLKIKYRTNNANLPKLRRRLKDFGENSHWFIKDKPRHNKNDDVLVREFKKAWDYGRTTMASVRMRKCNVMYDLVHKHIKTMAVSGKCSSDDRQWLWTTWQRKDKKSRVLCQKILPIGKKCGKEIPSFSQMDCGHIKKNAVGGPKKRSNLQPEHYSCNRKDNQPY